MTNDNNHYIADEGKIFVRIIDSKIMGNDLYLGLFVDGDEDTIDNYKEEVDNGNNAESQRYPRWKHNTRED